MPLDRQHYTIASSRMVPTYPLLSVGIGLVLLFTPRADLRHMSMGLAFVDDQIGGLWLWGVGFVALAAGMTLARILQRRNAYEVGLALLMVWLSAFAGALFVAALNHSASYLGFILTAFAARCCWATFLSLESRET